MKKKGNKNQEYKGFQWFLMLPLIPLIIFSVLMGNGNCESTTENWIMLVTSCVSSFATIILGLLVYFQTKNYRENDEQKEKKYREEQEKNRQQDLMIKANPVVYLQNISRFDFNNHFVISTVNSSFGNNLYEIKPKEKSVASSCFFSFDLVFKNDFGKLVDFITILSANLVCQKGNFTDESYEEKIVKSFSNFNDRKALIKVTDCGNIVVLLQLFLNNIDTEEVKFWLQDETIVWSLRFIYCLSNSCGVEVGFESQIVFNVEPNSIETSLGVKCKPNIKQIVTWQRSAVTVSKENKYELNT